MAGLIADGHFAQSPWRSTAAGATAWVLAQRRAVRAFVRAVPSMCAKPIARPTIERRCSGCSSEKASIHPSSNVSRLSAGAPPHTSRPVLRAGVGAGLYPARTAALSQPGFDLLSSNSTKSSSVISLIGDPSFTRRSVEERLPRDCTVIKSGCGGSRLVSSSSSIQSSRLLRRARGGRRPTG